MTRTQDLPRSESQLDASDELGQLIARAGARPQPPPDMEADVREAVYTAWRDETARRSWARRWSLGLAAAAAALVAGIGWHLGPGAEAPPSVTVGAVQRAAGEVSVQWTDGTLHAVSDDATILRVGDGLTTGVDGGARVRFTSMIELRVAPKSRVWVLATDRLRLESGAIFIDSRSRPQALVIETPSGSVSHVGTRYQVLVGADATTVLVREGQVSLGTATTQVIARAEEKVVLSAGGRIAHSTIPIYGAEWRWADALAEPLQIDGVALSEFLEWVAVETGRTLAFASEDAQSAARSTTLHGSIEGMSPDEALHAVLTTTDLSADMVASNLIVQRKPGR